MKNNKGFSLVELIVVIAIMAILVGIAVPIYSGYIDRAKETKDASFLANLSYATQIFAADNGLELGELWVAPVVKSGKGLTLYLIDGSIYDGDLSELYSLVGEYDFETIESNQTIIYREDVTPPTESLPEESAGTCVEHVCTTVQEPDCYQDGYEKCTVEGCGYIHILAHGHDSISREFGNVSYTVCTRCGYILSSEFAGNNLGN